MTYSVTWTDTMTKRLEELWKDGVSITEIGRKLTAEFRVEITRNAVVGKAMRTGLSKRYKRPAALTRAPKAPEPAPARAVRLPPFVSMQTRREQAVSLYNGGYQIADIAAAMRITEATVRGHLHDARRTGLLEPATPRARRRSAAPGITAIFRVGDGDLYGRWGCQWIEGDPKVDGTKCGAERFPTRPYCEAHCRRAYTGFQAIEIAPENREAAA